MNVEKNLFEKATPGSDRGRALRLWAACAVILLAASGCNMVSHGHNMNGVAKFEQGDHQGALADFQLALKNNPNSADAFYNMGATLHRLGTINQRQEDLELAEAYYHDCLDRDLNHEDCYRALAVMLTEQGRADDAFALMRNWVDHNPTAAEPLIELARLHEEFGDREAAKQRLIQAVQVDPNSSRALAALGNVRHQMGESQQALADFQRSLELNHLQPELQQRVAMLNASLNPRTLASPPPRTRTVVTPGGVFR